ncbi:MAG: putative sulfate exporter family transporter [Pseudomonadales bacterium]|nr:putative sulfate exporter family transporter [Pseudomonadales bacterium]
MSKGAPVAVTSVPEDRRQRFGFLGALLALPVVALVGHPVLALLAGALIVLVSDRQVIPRADVWSRYSLQAAIVLLGLRLDLSTLWTLSASYSWAVAAYVLGTLALGLLAGRLLAVEPASRTLISSGTAICGGTAIATLAAIVRAEPRQTAVALAIVFLLNVVALLSFPAIGRALELSQLQFGLWAALAIHDTSSVVATAAQYGDEALEVATTIKLGRTLWLIPLVFVLAVREQARARSFDGSSGARGVPRPRIPGFILVFVAAAALGSLVPLPDDLLTGAGAATRLLLATALFLVGTQLTRATLRQVRGRVLWLGVGLWLLVAPLTLWLVVSMA